MKFIYKILFFVIVFVVGYFIGQFVPWNLLHPTIANKEISMNDYYTRLISIVGALATLFATAVALLKEEIINYFKSPRLNVTFKNNLSLDGKELTADLSISSDKKLITAYVSQIELINEGKGMAKNIEIIVDKIYNKPTTHVTHTYYDITQFAIIPIGKGKDSGVFNLHKTKGKAFFTIVEISLPQVESIGTPILETNENHTSNEAISLKPIMKIGDFIVPEKDCNISEMFIEIIIYADNCNHIHKKMKVSWSGEWANTIELMNKMCKIEFV